MTDNRPDPFTEHLTQALRDGRIKMVGDEDRPAANTTDQLRGDLEQAMRPAVDTVIADATRPWRRFTFWLLAGYLLLGTLTVIQWWVTR